MNSLEKLLTSLKGDIFTYNEIRNAIVNIGLEEVQHDYWLVDQGYVEVEQTNQIQNQCVMTLFNN